MNRMLAIVAAISVASLLLGSAAEALPKDGISRGGGNPKGSPGGSGTGKPPVVHSGPRPTHIAQPPCTQYLKTNCVR
jgi:hypothetical protein